MSGRRVSSLRRSSEGLCSIAWLKTFCQDKESESGESWIEGPQVLKDEKSLSRPSERESGDEGDDERERFVPKVMVKESLGRTVARRTVWVRLYPGLHQKATTVLKAPFMGCGSEPPGLL